MMTEAAIYQAGKLMDFAQALGFTVSGFDTSRDGRVELFLMYTETPEPTPQTLAQGAGQRAAAGNNKDVS